MSKPMLLTAFALSMLSTACVSGDTGAGPGPGGAGPDAGTPPSGASCLVEASYGDLGAVSGGSAVVVPQDANVPTGPRVVVFNVGFTSASAPAGPQDLLHVELWEGLGVFAGGFKPGTYPIAGDETDFFKCSTCVVIAGDFDTTANKPAKTYMAKGGTITITAVDPTVGTGKLTGSIAGVTFADVDVSGAAQVALTDGCATAVSSMTFDLGMAAPQ